MSKLYEYNKIIAMKFKVFSSQYLTEFSNKLKKILPQITYFFLNYGLKNKTLKRKREK